MKLQLSKWALILGAPIVLFGYQNCAKLGTNGIAVNDQTLSLAGEQPVGDQTPTVPTTTAPATDAPVTSTPATNPPAANPPIVSPTSGIDPDIADAVKACNDEKRLSAPATNLQLSVTQSVIKLDAYKVASISGIQGQYVLVRAADENGTVGPVNISQTTLILCGFKTVQSIKGSQNRVIVVGSSIEEIDGMQNQFLLVNSSVNKVGGAQSKVKYYTLQ